MPRWLTRSLRPPPDDITPNTNDPAGVPPSTVGPDQLVTPGDPHGVELVDSDPGAPNPPSRILASAWSGWPADWWPPAWGGHVSSLTDTAWACLDRNAKALASMPPYLVNAAPTVDAGWLTNPDPDLYTSWDEFAKQVFWDFQGVGEAFVLATARYATGWPARFHVVPAAYVNVEMDGGRRSYSIGDVDLDQTEILHLRYQSSTDDAHGHSPLEVGAGKLIAADILGRYATGLASAGGIPSSVLEHPERLTATQAGELREQWVLARQSALGEPAVLSGGVTWKPTQLNPKDMALLDLLTWNDQAICRLLGVPAHLMNVPTNDSMTYSNVTDLYDSHWRETLLPMASHVLNGLSAWLLPRGTEVEVNSDAYVRQQPLQRAQTYQILAGIQDTQGNPVLSVEQIQQAERITNATPQEGAIR